MEILSTLSQWIHGSAIAIILAIVGCTMGMSIFLFKMVIQDDRFSSYDRNL